MLDSIHALVEGAPVFGEGDISENRTEVDKRLL